MTESQEIQGEAASGAQQGTTGRTWRTSSRPPRQEQPGEPREGYTALGRVLRPHGLRGELRVEAFAPGAPNMQEGRRVYIDGVRRKVARARSDRGGWILQLDGLTDRAEVESYRGLLIEAADRDVRREDEESFFLHELIGLRVVTDGGEELGRVTEVLQQGAADVYVVQGPRGEVLLPAIGEVVLQINLDEQFMRITLLPGLLDDSK